MAAPLWTSTSPHRPRLRAKCTTVQHEAGGAPPENEEQNPRPVAGTVRIMTDEPLEVSADPDSGGLAAGLRQLSRRPWIVPAALLGGAALYFLLRRR